MSDAPITAPAAEPVAPPPKPPELTPLEVMGEQQKHLKKAQGAFSDMIKLLRVARSDALKDSKGSATPFIEDLEAAEKNAAKSSDALKGVGDYFDTQIKKEKDKEAAAQAKKEEKKPDPKGNWNLVLLQWGIILLVALIIFRIVTRS